MSKYKRWKFDEAKSVLRRRFPIYVTALLAGLMALSWAGFSSVSPPTPQAAGNAAWRTLWAGDAPAAATEFGRALESDPAFPYRWSDLGEALADAGRTGEARYCFRRAMELAPASPEIRLRAANFAFRTGSGDEALSLESGILRDAPEYDQMIFRSWIRMVGDARAMLDTGIGNNARAAAAFFDFLIANADRETLDTTWRWMESRGYAGPRQSREWVDWLLRSNDAAEAAEVWAGHVALDGREYRKSNWIDNGGFERDWLGGGLDWNSAGSPGVKAAADATVAHSGKRSLRLDVKSEENLDFHHFFQRTWMSPGRYRLEAWIRTSGFSTDQGIGLRALDAADESGVNVYTPAITGTQEWTRVTRDFVVAGHPRLVEIQIVRRPSWSYDNHPRGTAWIDDVSVGPLR